jgi:hypothetical protein
MRWVTFLVENCVRSEAKTFTGQVDGIARPPKSSCTEEDSIGVLPTETGTQRRRYGCVLNEPSARVERSGTHGVFSTTQGNRVRSEVTKTPTQEIGIRGVVNRVRVVVDCITLVVIRSGSVVVRAATPVKRTSWQVILSACVMETTSWLQNLFRTLVEASTCEEVRTRSARNHVRTVATRFATVRMRSATVGIESAIEVERFTCVTERSAIVTEPIPSLRNRSAISRNG